MKNTAKQIRLTWCLLGSALTAFLGACETAPSATSSPAVAPAATAAAKLDQAKALALVESYAKKQQIDFSRFDRGSARMARRSDGSIYWAVSYPRVWKKDEVVLQGADMLLFTVDEDTKEVKSVPTF